jgi:hypothetical protein
MKEMAMAKAKSAGSLSLTSLTDFMDQTMGSKSSLQLPAQVKEFIVTYGPWADIVLLVLLAPGILLALGLGTAVLPFSGLNGVDAAAGLTIALVALVVQVVLMIAALPGLFARRVNGWNLSLLSVLMSFVYSLLTFQLVSGLIGVAISLFVLAQIRSYYR